MTHVRFDPSVSCRNASCLHWLRRSVALFLVLAGFEMSVAGAIAAESADSSLPNIVLIMADDLGYWDVSCYRDNSADVKNRFGTPHLDRLASEGLRFTNYHSNGAVCSPTRAALMTGRYQQRAGIDGVINADPNVNRDTGLAQSEFTVAELLKPKGYQTAIIGKWHLGYEPQFNPTLQGFDRFRGYLSGNVDYFSHLDRMGIADWWHDRELHPEVGYTTHLITKHALQFIQENKESPFLLYVAHESVHAPYQGPDDKAIRSENKEDNTPEVGKRNTKPVYASMITEMDQGIGEIVQLLKDLNLARKTLVIFISDNGANSQGDNGPLRGFKGSLWEGGHRVPCIVWQPDRIQSGRVNETVLSMDWLPTLARLTDARIPDELQLDGVDLTDLIYDRKPLTERYVYWKAGNKWAIRKGTLKLISESPKEPPALFDLSTDLGEQRDLSQEFPETVQVLEEQYAAWRAELLLQQELSGEPQSN